MTSHTFTALTLALALTACAAPSPQPMVDAATAPLNDLNIIHATIPPVLVEAQKKPYAAPADTSCAALASELKALDEVLGPDLDAPASMANPGLIERGATFVTDEAVGTVRSAAEGVIPYRKWVRKVSGAERYAKDVAAAIAAGTVRRGFVKGMRVAGSCVT